MTVSGNARYGAVPMPAMGVYDGGGVNRRVSCRGMHADVQAEVVPCCWSACALDLSWSVQWPGFALSIRVSRMAVLCVTTAARASKSSMSCNARNADLRRCGRMQVSRLFHRNASCSM